MKISSEKTKLMSDCVSGIHKVSFKSLGAFVFDDGLKLHTKINHNKKVSRAQEFHFQCQSHNQGLRCQVISMR